MSSVVGLDRQDLLQRVPGAVGFQGPHFHLAEALATELGFATERLLGDERVWSRRRSVDPGLSPAGSRIGLTFSGEVAQRCPRSVGRRLRTDVQQPLQGPR